MQPEQQQRILGYFLEEAREHLNTIEQGLLNLQSTLEDSEMINEVFRAAHSIKGSATMLGLSSIQQTSHRLEDCFKILKEHPIQVDQRLESLLLDVCDTLKALIDSLGNPFGLSAEKAQALMLKTEPVMQWLNEHIETLLKQGNNGVNNLNHNHLQPPISVIPQIQKSPVTTRQNQDWTEFQGQVLEILREMLQQFKQTNLGRSRENLQECCHQLVKIGRDLNLSNWCSLCESAALAISNPDHSYLTLAKIIITEIKQAQELVLQNQDAKIAISQQLETLFPLPQLDLLEFEETEAEETLFTDTTELNTTNTTGFINQSLFNHHQSIFTHNPPEIGLSELNSLADLFESDTPDLDDNWQQEEILEDITNYQLLITNSEVEENHHDLADLLFFENDDKHETTANNGDDLTLLFDDNLLETDNISLLNLQSETVDSQPIEFGNLLDNSPDLQFPSDDVLTELISISRKSRQLDPENEATNTNKLEELLTFTEDDELSVIFEITEAENIALSEIASASEISFDNLLLEEDKYAKNQADENANSSGKIIHTTIKTSKIKPSAPESLSLDNLFVEVAKNSPPPTNEIDDLFGTSEITTNLANSIDNLDNFWDDLDTTDSKITTSVNQDIAKELEESLFRASVEIVPKNQHSATNNSLDRKEFDLISQAQEQSFDLFFTSDTDSQPQEPDNLFGDFGDVTYSTVPIVEFNELFWTEVNDFPQSPEELNSIPEFTHQPPKITANLQIVENVEDENDHNLILFTEEITDSLNTVSEELIANIDISDLTTFIERETILSESEVEANLNFNANLADSNLELSSLDEFAAIEAFLSAFPEESPRQESIQDEDFAALEALLSENEDNGLKISSQPPIIIQPTVVKSQNTFLTLRQVQDNVLGLEDEFSELENLLEQADQKISNSSATSRKTSTGKIPRPMTRRTIKEENMKIPVKQLDDMSNLVGELVVNRNTLEQDHERLRQALDSLLLQVQHLSDVGMRMQEYYERSLLESSLLSTRRSREYDNSSDNSHNRGFSDIEMDRFTPFHILAQEMIEFIVGVRESASDIDFITEETEQVSRQLRQATNQLQAGLTKARMVPFAQAVDRLRRGVRDNAIRYGKQVELVTEGVDTLVDKMILDHLTDPLTHMVNNAIAHGIETPEIRQAAGKSPTGIINIRALQQGNQTIISVSDDGAGIDHQKVKNKAVKKGILTPEQAQTMSRIDAYELLFLSSFSTADEVDDIKGRGMGMNVVQNDISEIRGTVGTDSTLGKGTSFTIRLPLTLSICKALFCICDRTRIAFPMDGVEDTLSIAAKNIQQDAQGQSFIVWRDINLPFQPLKDILVFNRQLTCGNVYGTKKDDDLISVIIVRAGNTMIALQIDQILSEQEIVIKQFEGPAPKPSGIAGATVLGDGMIMPIADVLEIIDIFQGKMSKHIGGNWQHSGLSSIDISLADKVEITVLIVDDSITVRELLSLTFTKAGYRVEQARDGQEAWDKLRSGLPCDIVFCDIEMPRCDGLEFLSRVQKDSSFDQLPIAMLTSRGADKHRQMALQLGASGYFTKPYLEEALLEAASRMLKGEKLVIA
ncbi:hybrid sensor histidine kinase/response regulator [Dolichospermum flos-aquae]|uniref:histidine kinase n=1 Tax=Dolichospermum flos-aquae CCAP 1403/13F TaxID=315271 RepID=A0A6H2C743_DOLFA|nr:hybrid sensor histidine kinase/response regulator [Dolichospermum flos-aquae]QJB46824.1 response regulator [Dolichospermum flos-aquae CCAP 1403/13F]